MMNKLMIGLVGLLLLLSTGPACALAHEEDWYEYGTVTIVPPVRVDSTTSGTTVSVMIPGWGPGTVVGSPSLKSCKKWEDFGRDDWAALPKPTIDKWMTVVAAPTNYRTGEFAFVIGDLAPHPRVQWICPRVPSVQTQTY